MKKRPTGHTLWPEKEIYGRHTFRELVDGEENTDVCAALGTCALAIVGSEVEFTKQKWRCRMW